MKKPALLFYGDNEKAGLYRTFSHMNPELFIEAQKVRETVDKKKVAIDAALQAINTQFGPREIDKTITEVSDIFPQNIQIQFGDITTREIYNAQNIPHNTGLRQRPFFINGTYFMIRETSGNTPGILEVYQMGEYLDIPENIKANDKDFLIYQLGNRKKVLSIEKVSITDIYSIETQIKNKLVGLKGLSIGFKHSDISDYSDLLRNWEFMFWYLHFLKQSSQK